MNTRDFAFDGLVGKVRRWNQRCEFDEALYLTAMGRLFPQVQVNLAELRGKNGNGSLDLSSFRFNVGIQGSITLHNILTDFAKLAAYIQELHGLSDENGTFDWPRATAPDAQIDRALQHCIDNPDAWKKIADIAVEAESPNGVEGKPESELTPEERNDPLSASADGNTRMISVAN